VKPATKKRIYLKDRSNGTAMEFMNLTTNAQVKPAENKGFLKGGSPNDGFSDADYADVGLSVFAEEAAALF